MIGSMNNFDNDGTDFAVGVTFSIECSTCLATGTTACADCVVAHLLANDDGPIDLVTVPIAAPLSVTDRAIGLFVRAGLVEDPIEFVRLAEFETGIVAEVGAR